MRLEAEILDMARERYLVLARIGVSYACSFHLEYAAMSIIS